MRTNTTSRLLICLITIIVLSFSCSSIANNYIKQEDEQAKKLLEELTDKISYCLSLLEKASKRNINVRDLVLEVDHALQLKHVAERYYLESQYQQSITTSLEALDLLDSVVISANQLLDQKQKTTTVIGIIIGFCSAIGTLAFLYLFYRYVFPWYKRQQISQYEELEIVYEDGE
ncbi:MAG: hypothetical protein ACTSYD_09405 [Candidatus Heimdallarchaeaceae archaeon]